MIIKERFPTFILNPKEKNPYKSTYSLDNSYETMSVNMI